MKFLSPLDINGYVSLLTQNPGVTPTKFLVQDSQGRIAFRTGQELKVDIGADYTSVLKHQVKASVAINKGQAVYAIPTQDGTNILVGLASNNSEATSSKTMGLLNATVLPNGFADVITEGLLSGLNTSTATVGDPVWLGTNGNLIYGLAAKPYAPAHLVFIGIVTRVNANNGEIFVKVQNGFELDELHDVDLKTTTPVNGHILGFNGTLWVNKTIAGWLGYTPQNAATAITTSNIGSQSVNYANSAAVATNADYANSAGYAGNAGTLDGYDSSYFYPASNPNGYISSYTETDPTVPSYVKSITATEKSNWNTAYGWGNHALAGYVPQTRTITINGVGYDLSANRSWTISATAVETDTLATVTARGATTSVRSSFDGGITVNGQSYVTANGYFISGANGFRWNDSSGNYNNVIMRDNGTTWFRNYLETPDSMRAPIFYDSNNTGYYVDPASTSKLNALTLSSLASDDGKIENNTGAYFHIGEWGVARLATGAVLVNTAYRADRSDFADRATYLDPNYVGGQQTNPQTYFNNGVGVKVAMTAQAGYWSDTLWINGYSGGDVPWMCALHTQRNSSPRMYISAQQHTSSSYGTLYEFWTGYNMDAPNKSGTSYYQTNTWMQFNGAYGLYWPNNNGTHIHSNDGSTYTQVRIQGSKNGYGGIFDSYSSVNGFMYDSAGNGGIYREANGRWYLYHHVGNNCTGISTSTTSGSYRAYIGGSLYAEGDIVAYSDRRKKENIVTVDNALDTVNKLRGVYYNRIDDDSKRRQVGVIAQETQEVLPEVVTYAEDIDEYGVAYGNITGVLIEAIKEQQTQIEELKELVNQLIKK